MQSVSVPCGAAASTPQDLHSAVVALKRSTAAGRDSFGKEPSRIRIILSTFAHAIANGDARYYSRERTPSAVQNEARRDDATIEMVWSDGT